jgi:hypothetical protein
MKPLADGYLHNSVDSAFRHALRYNPTCLVSGFNSVEMLRADADAVCRGALDDAENAELMKNAPELGNYVCRQCEKCSVTDDSLLKKLFELEGKFDRQMDDLHPVDAGTYALRQRLCKWFGNAERAREQFVQNPNFLNIDIKNLSPCRYGIDIPRKIKIVNAKLNGGKLTEL